MTQNRNDDLATDHPVGTQDTNNIGWETVVRKGIQSWNDATNTAVSQLWDVIEDSTTSLDAGSYTVNPLTGSVSPAHTLVDGGLICIRDSAGNVSATNRVIIDLGGTIEIIDISGVGTTDTSGILELDYSGAAADIVRVGDNYRVNKYNVNNPGLVPEVDINNAPLGSFGKLEIVKDAGGSAMQLTDSSNEIVS